MKVLCCVILVFWCSLVEAAHLNVFLFAGQSNMFGADAIADGLCTASRCTSGQGVLDLNGLGTQTAADLAALFTLKAYGSGTLVYALGDIRGHNGVTFGFETNTGAGTVKGFGPEVGFNRTLYAANLRNIAIIKFSGNYSALEGGKSAWVSPNSLWAAWQTEIATQLAAMVSAGHTYTIIGAVWHQGIDDAILGRTQAEYETDLIQIIADVRTAYGATLPFILARSILSPFGSTMVQVRAGQVAVATATSRSGWVDFDDATIVNSHHMTAASQIIGGNRFGTLMISLAPGLFGTKASHTGKIVFTGNLSVTP